VGEQRQTWTPTIHVPSFSEPKVVRRYRFTDNFETKILCFTLRSKSDDFITKRGNCLYTACT
jgi:hypothetical protein